jgi:hypothetical protein
MARDVEVALCLKNTNCDDLEIRKLYRLLPDDEANAEKYLRIIDESGEDYLYPAANFAVLRVPAGVAKSMFRGRSR